MSILFGDISVASNSDENSSGEPWSPGQRLLDSFDAASASGLIDLVHASSFNVPYVDIDSTDASRAQSSQAIVPYVGPTSDSSSGLSTEGWESMEIRASESVLPPVSVTPAHSSVAALARGQNDVETSLPPRLA